MAAAPAFAVKQDRTDVQENRNQNVFEWMIRRIDDMKGKIKSAQKVLACVLAVSTGAASIPQISVKRVFAAELETQGIQP